MEQFRSESPVEDNGSRAHRETITNFNEIKRQLNVSKEPYGGALEKLRAGDDADLDYLEEAQRNLIGFKNKFEIELGMMTQEARDTYTAVLERLFEVSEELEKYYQSKEVRH